MVDTTDDTVMRWKQTWVRMWTTTSTVGKEGGLLYYRTAYWTTTVLGGADAIRRGGDAWTLYNGKTANFPEPIIQSSGSFQYRHGSSDGKARIERLTDGWSWQRCMVWGPTLIF